MVGVNKAWVNTRCEAGVSECSIEELRSLMVGRAIVDYDYNRLLLDDGTILYFRESFECCSAYDPYLKIPKGVQVRGSRISGVFKDYTGVKDSFKVHIMAENRELAYIDVDGDEGTGYYLHSFWLDIGKYVLGHNKRR